MTNKMNALVLVGGKSERMGRQKHELLLPNNSSLLNQSISLLSQILPITNIYISCRSSQLPLPLDTKFLKVTTLVDLPTHANIGPASGLLAAFAHAPQATWVVFAVDSRWFLHRKLSSSC